MSCVSPFAFKRHTFSLCCFLSHISSDTEIFSPQYKATDRSNPTGKTTTTLFRFHLTDFSTLIHGNDL